MNVIKQATAGLRYLHDLEIIHKDFKPSNLLLFGSLNNFQVKVADFDDMPDIKNTITATFTTTKKQCVGMTLAYTAPELCTGLVMKPSYQTDVCSWSITIFEILSDQASPWANVLPVVNDLLLFEALKNNQRPLVDHLQTIYSKEDYEFIAPIIKKSWTCDSSTRPTLEQPSFNLFAYIYTHLFTYMSNFRRTRSHPFCQFSFSDNGHAQQKKSCNS
ncbi:receptor-interacting serine/threonine-protein kinase 1-like [Hydractinia symbiolongicarpus]|uniref:receptor-interacting serine/threonine-protein kinase 1-like n=1 Tax=Hydractinia symbiolongicarpus TaxID=13093 RepID=UPI0025504F11|nr:receptor-interacting serine/threonine-protein kinase 1-like [Hydractinia symbiolongicarpus]